LDYNGKELHRGTPGFVCWTCHLKEGLMVMCCANASENHKIKSVVIGMAKEPYLFKETEANGILFIITARKGHE
jgi:hypothetical protein